MSADDARGSDPRLLALDTGGTMTDTFVVDDEANYTVGKAQTTPDDESAGVMRSFEDALERWETSIAAGSEGADDGARSDGPHDGAGGDADGSAD